MKKQSLLEVARLQQLAGITAENQANSIEDPEIFDDVPSVRIFIDDKDGEDKLFLELSTFYHSGQNGKITLLKDSPELQQQLMLAVQEEAQAMFRRAVHKTLGEPFGLD
jgi:hypothetical protein